MSDPIVIVPFVSSSVICFNMHIMMFRLDMPIPTWQLTRYWRKRGFTG